MPVPPEVLFHRYFQRLKRKEDRELYRGKADLDRLPDEPLPRKLLEDVQVMLNAALAAEDRSVPQHVDRTDEEIREWAHEHDLPCFDEEVHFPDLRIEYRDRDGRE